MAQSEEGLDGAQLKEFVENESNFNKFVDQKFSELDVNKKGTLNRDEVTPIMGTLGEALGLPPLGASKDSDHIYDEIFAEFSQGKNVSKDTFANVLQDVFLGLADGLERDPISVVDLDGSALREYANSPKFESDTVSAFTGLDAEGDNRLEGSKLIEGLKTISVAKGMPPADDSKVKGIIKEALVKANVDLQESLDQFKFIDKFKAVVLAIADGMQKSPVEVAHAEKTYDGTSITSLLRDQTTLHQVLDSAWEKLPKDKKGKVSNDHLRKGVDEIAPAAGLPPVGAVDEMDAVLKTVLSKIDLSESVTVTKEKFDKIMLEILGSLMLQLDGKHINVNRSEVVDTQATGIV